jgi:hypothetical protein
MGARNRIGAIHRRARAEALALLTADLLAALPPGWRCVLAVGWGVTLLDAEGRPVGAIGHGASPHRPSAKLARAVKLAQDFGEWWWFENEQITGKTPARVTFPLICDSDPHKLQPLSPESQRLLNADSPERIIPTWNT